MLACVRAGKPAKGHKTYPYLLRGLRVDRPNQGLVRRHHIPAYAPGLSLSGGDHRLAYPDGSVVADLEHAGRRLLRRGAKRGDLSVRATRYHE